MFYCLISYGTTDWILKGNPVKNGVQMSKTTGAIWGCSRYAYAYDGGGESNFCHFDAYVLIE